MKIVFVVKVMGDGVLVEFGSAVDAEQCAVELEKGFTEANQGVPEPCHVIPRIGINPGDVIVEGSDIYGEGVNIAARLEALAEPPPEEPTKTSKNFPTTIGRE